MKALLPILLVAIATGCNRDERHTETTPTDITERELARIPSMHLPISKGDALVTVNGRTLTFSEAEQEVQFRLNAVTNRVPAERIEDIRRQTVGTVAEQFVMRTLLLEEATRRNITVADEDERAAFVRIQEKLKPGVTVEQAMKESPMGEKRMREEVITGIKINKLLAMEMTNAVPVTDMEVANFIQESRAPLTLPESVRAHHILFSVDDSAPQSLQEEKRTQAETVRSELLNGGDFGELARKYSDCPSKQRGGDLGTFARGQMVKPFEEAAFTQKVGEIGPLVKSPFGFHIIRVDEHREAGPVSREHIERVIRSRHQQATVLALINSLKAKASIEYNPMLKAQTPVHMPSTLPATE